MVCKGSLERQMGRGRGDLRTIEGKGMHREEEIEGEIYREDMDRGDSGRGALRGKGKKGNAKVRKGRGEGK